ncbi:MAG: diguanylate cyclase, partial [Chloroflexi bacterium CFX2]|nr:diguanylate cyclase [Chloroflexi bacterium CFX2]
SELPAITPYFWLDITLAGAFTVPTAFLVFALEYSNARSWLNRPFILALIIEPVIVFILLWTDPWHDLYFGGKRALNTVMILDAGPVHWANIYYSYLLILISLLILVVTFRRSKGVYQRQAAMILAAAVVPWLVHAGFLLSGGGLLPNADMTPFIFSFTALFIAFALIRYRLLDIVPIARSALIESMGEGVLVLDSNNRIVDVNPAARKELAPDFSLGDPVETALKHLPNLVEKFSAAAQARTEITVGEITLDLSISTLLDAKRRPMGRLVVWRDITAQKQTRDKLEKLAITDELTSTHNRRHFMEMAESQISFTRRYGTPLALAMIDLDHFKEINDTCGHQAGDKALAGFAGILRGNIRDFDILGRLGGEEFAILMPKTDEQAALRAVERLRVTLAENPIVFGGNSIRITFSLGLTDFKGGQDSLESLLRRADHALYEAKKAGRNQIMVWRKEEEEKFTPPD